MIIFFFGPDCSGKDSLMHEVAKLYNYEHYMSPRSPICNIVYDIIYNRNQHLKESNLELIGSFLERDAYFVFVYAKPEILLKRALARNEKHVNKLDVFKKHIEIYKQVIKECKLKFEYDEHKFLEIDNSGNLKQTALQLVEEIKKC